MWLLSRYSREDLCFPPWQHLINLRWLIRDVTVTPFVGDKYLYLTLGRVNHRNNCRFLTLRRVNHRSNCRCLSLGIVNHRSNCWCLSLGRVNHRSNCMCLSLGRVNHRSNCRCLSLGRMNHRRNCRCSSLGGVYHRSGTWVVGISCVKFYKQNIYITIANIPNNKLDCASFL